MTSALSKFEILRKDNKWNSMPPEQDQIIALVSVVEKLKDDNLNIFKSFKESPPVKDKGKVKGKGKFKVQVKKPPGKQSQYGKVKSSERSKNQKMWRPTPRK